MASLSVPHRSLDSKSWDLVRCMANCSGKASSQWTLVKFWQCIDYIFFLLKPLTVSLMKNNLSEKKKHKHVLPPVYVFLIIIMDNHNFWMINKHFGALASHLRPSKICQYLGYWVSPQTPGRYADGPLGFTRICLPPWCKPLPPACPPQFSNPGYATGE